MEIDLSTADITTVPTGAIVNAAHHALRGGGGVDGAIHRAGGPSILADCIKRYPHGVPTGEAGWTTAGNLPAEYVIHVVGPNYTAGQRDPGLLESCYRNALRLADELGVDELTAPAVSAGIYGWPEESAAENPGCTRRSRRCWWGNGKRPAPEGSRPLKYQEDQAL
jgi:O-acetyl-ADP-ribose deacetylase (regulator of RNase III)